MLVFLGLVVLSMIVAGVVIYRLSQDPSVQKAFSAAKEGLSIYMDARSAPGTDEMRTLGCREAMAIDTHRLIAIVNDIDAPDAAEPDPEDVVSPMLYCMVGWRSTLTCEKLVQAYVQAVPDAPDEMIAQIEIEGLGDNESRCSGIYSREGEFLRSFDEEDMPVPDESDLPPPSE